MSQHFQKFKAVIFDFGGVISTSPFPFIEEYEKSLNLPKDTFNKAIVKIGNEGAFPKLERGEISLNEFYIEFEKEITSLFPNLENKFSAKKFIDAICSIKIQKEMIRVVEILRDHNIKTALLTNNFATPNFDFRNLSKHFNVIVESYKIGLRKPDHRIYNYTLNELKVKPEETIFLDDIGQNLKSAAELGIKTIKVINIKQAIKDLESILGITCQ